MKILFTLVLLMVLASVGYAQQASQPPSGSNLKLALAGAKSHAEAAAISWLGVIDSGNYGKSWDLAADSFKGAITQKEWITQVQPVADQTGKFKSRSLKAAYFTEMLPNSPEGDYVLIEYNSSYQNVNNAVETIIMALQPDGTWKTGGYFVKAAS